MRLVRGVVGTAFMLVSLFSCGGGGSNPKQTADPQPPQLAQIPRSTINHLLIVVMQNSSFDHLFGTFPGANGLNPSAPSYRQVD